MLEFFTTLFKEGNLGYSSLNLARGALSSLGLTIDSIPVGRHAMVIRYMKGIFNLRPPRPRYESTWDVSKVLHFLRSLSPVKYLKLKDLRFIITNGQIWLYLHAKNYSEYRLTCEVGKVLMPGIH